MVKKNFRGLYLENSKDSHPRDHDLRNQRAEKVLCVDSQKNRDDPVMGGKKTLEGCISKTVKIPTPKTMIFGISVVRRP